MLAIATTPDGVVCKAGPGAANVRDPALQALIAAGAPPFGDVLGETPDGVRTLVERDGRDRPLGAMYFLDHAREHPELRFEPTTDPQLLLGHTFNVLVRTAGAARRPARAVRRHRPPRAAVPRSRALRRFGRRSRHEARRARPNRLELALFPT